MSLFTVLRNTCLASTLIVAVGCATEPAKPQLTPAQQAIQSMSYNQKAEKFLDLIHADKMATPAYMQVQGMFEQLFIDSKAPANKQAVLESYLAKADAVLDKNIGWDVLKPEVVKLYTSNFTENELAQLIEFYESPTGQKMLKQLPMVTMQTTRLIQSKIPKAAPEINVLVEQMARDLGVSLEALRKANR